MAELENYQAQSRWNGKQAGALQCTKLVGQAGEPYSREHVQDGAMQSSREINMYIPTEPKFSSMDLYDPTWKF